MKKKLISVTSMSLFMLNSTAYATTIALLSWDLVDSGKHMDWAGSTTYMDNFTAAIDTWEDYKPGVIRKDTASTIKDLTVSDYNERSSTAGTASKSGTIKFNTYLMDDFSKAKRTNVALHELGHALGLAHNTTSDIMHKYTTTKTTLSTNDKASYDAAYLNY